MKGLPRERIQSFYDCPNPFRKKGARQVQALFWPCTVFTVAISQQKSDALNIFEKAILRLISLGIRDKDLAETLAIKMDFLRFWQERLNQRGYLSGSKLTEAAIKFVNGKEDEVYKNVLMYREELEGALLPFCVSGAPQYLQTDARGAFFGNPATPDRIFSPLTILPRPFPNRQPPEPGLIMNALRKYDLWRATTPLACPQYSDPVSISGDNTVKIISDGHFVYLYCVCSLSPSGKEALVYSPFGYVMFQRELGKALGQSKEFQEVMEALLSKVEEKNQESKKDAVPEEIFSGLDEADKSVLASLGETAMALRVFSGNAPDQNRELQMKRRNSAKNFASHICSAFENIFGRLLQDCSKNEESARRLRKILDIAIHEDSETNSLRLRKSAQETGFNKEHDCGHFLGITPEEARNFKNGLSNLRVLFAVNLMLARQSGTAHPFWSLAVSQPDFINLLAFANGLNNAFGHGASPELPEIDKMRELFSAAMDLLLSYRQNYENSAKRLLDWLGADQTSHASTGDISSARLNEFFSATLLRDLPADYYDMLVDSENEFVQVRLDENSPEISRMEISSKTLKPLYAFCQRVFSEIRKSYSPQAGDWQKNALSAATMAGFRLDKGKLPSVIASTRQKNVEGALRKGNTTLGGEAIAFLCSIPDDRLRDIADKSPGLLLRVDRLITLREHGSGNILAEHALSIRNDMYGDLEPLLQMLK